MAVQWHKSRGCYQQHADADECAAESSRSIFSCREQRIWNSSKFRRGASCDTAWNHSPAAKSVVVQRSSRLFQSDCGGPASLELPVAIQWHELAECHERISGVA